ncbi:LysM peptidoglycan-binding domain-containing protein [Cellulomonas sp. URHB0016]
MGQTPPHVVASQKGQRLRSTGLLVVGFGACAALAMVLVTHASGLLSPAAGPRRVDTLVEIGVTVTGLAVVAWLGCSALLALGCVAVRAAGVTWRSGERVLLRYAPAVVRRALVLAIGTGLGLGMVTSATAAEPAAEPAGVTVTSTALPVGPDQDLGWAVTGSDGSEVTDAGPAGSDLTSSATAVPTDAPSSAGISAASSSQAAAEPTTNDPVPPSAPAASVATSTAPSEPEATASTRTSPAAHLLAPPVRQIPEAGPATVVVLRGDSLWRIAARHLPAGADDAQVAAAWPAWYAANAELIGADPGALLPGQVLVVPPTATVDGAGA